MAEIRLKTLFDSKVSEPRNVKPQKVHGSYFVPFFSNISTFSFSTFKSVSTVYR